MQTKRRSFAHKIRPQSVVENLSLGHIPDLLESPSSRRSSNSSAGKNDENCDSITELPSASFQLQHLVKGKIEIDCDLRSSPTLFPFLETGRPKRAKTRAPTRPLVTELSTHTIGEGLEAFFRPGSVTPTTLTPLVSPTSDECSSLSFVDSPTMSRCDDNGKNYFTSEETTPVHEERKPIKLDRSSPLLKGVAWTPRSRSTDNLEKYSPLIGRKSPLIKMQNDQNAEDKLSERLHPPAQNESKIRSPSNDSIKSIETEPSVKATNGILNTPILPSKPRPWSVAGNEGKCDFSGDTNKTTPDAIDPGIYFH